MKPLCKKVSVCLLLLCGLLGMNGCANLQMKQLKDQAIVQGIGVDQVKEGFQVTFQVLDISKAGGSASDSKGTITTTYTSKGKTVSSAVAEGQKVLDRETFLAQNKVIVLSKDVAEHHLDQVLDFFIRSRNCRPDVQVAVTTDSAKKVMESKCKDAVIPAEKIQKTLINGEYNGKSVNRMILNVVNDSVNPTSDVYLPVVKLFDKGENVTLSGVGVFAEGKKPFYLDDRETRGLLWADNKVRNGTIVVETEKLGKITLHIVSSKSKSKANVRDNKIFYRLSVKCYTNIDEMEEGIKATVTEEELKEIQKKAQKVIRSEIQDAMEKCLRENQCDVFKIGRLLSQSEYGFYKKIKDSYPEQLPFVQYEISPEVEIKRLDNEALNS